MNLIKTQELVNCALIQLKQCQRHFGDVKLEADNFINYINEQFNEKHEMDVLIEKDFSFKINQNYFMKTIKMNQYYALKKDIV
jgi:hypothetical protein